MLEVTLLVMVEVNGEVNVEAYPFPFTEEEDGNYSYHGLSIGDVTVESSSFDDLDREQLNALAGRIEGLEYRCSKAIEALVEDYNFSLEEAVTAIVDEKVFFHKAESMEELAYNITVRTANEDDFDIESATYFDYIDFVDMGEDMEMEGSYAVLDNGWIIETNM